MYICIRMYTRMYKRSRGICFLVCLWRIPIYRIAHWRFQFSRRPPRGWDPLRYDLYPDRLPSPPKPASVRADVSAISEFARVVKRTYKPVTNSLRTLGHENYIPGNLWNDHWGSQGNLNWQQTFDEMLLRISNYLAFERRKVMYTLVLLFHIHILVLRYVFLLAIPPPLFFD